MTISTSDSNNGLVPLADNKKSVAQNLVDQFTASMRATGGAPYSSLSTIMSTVPLMNFTANTLEDEADRPFKDKHFVLLLHALGNAVAFVIVLMRLGADPRKITFYYKDYQYAHRQKVLSKIDSLGITILPVETCDDTLPNRLRIDDLPIVYVVDGAYPAIAGMKHADLAARTLGVVEQTTKGIRRLRAAFGKKGPSCPVISVPDSRIKSQFEPPHIAKAVLDSVVALLPTVSPTRMKVGVLGAGAVGKEIVEAVVGRGCTARVHDPCPEKMLNMSSKSVDLCRSPQCAVKDADIVVGASGECSITPSVIAAMKNGAFIVSASSDRVELDWPYLNRIATAKKPLFRDENVAEHDVPIGTTFTIGTQEKKIKVLGDGMPLNFMSIGMADDSADLVMSLLLLAAYEVATGKWKSRKGILTDAMNEIADRHRVADTYLNLILN